MPGNQNPLPTMADPSVATRRYTPPNQSFRRNRSLNRRKSRDRLDRTNISSGNDGEGNQPPSSRNAPVSDHGDAVTATLMDENSRPSLISLEGCHRSEAYQLLHERWATAIHRHGDPTIDYSERPVMVPRSDVWGRLPHQLMPSANRGPSSGSQIDFLNELRHQMQNASSND